GSYSVMLVESHGAISFLVDQPNLPCLPHLLSLVSSIISHLNQSAPGFERTVPNIVLVSANDEDELEYSENSKTTEQEGFGHFNWSDSLAPSTEQTFDCYFCHDWGTHKSGFNTLER